MEERPPLSTDGSGRGPATGVRALLVCGAAAGPLFTLAYLAEGATRAHYSALRHPVSSLALGEYGWTQALNFITASLLTLAFAAGVRRALRPSKGSTWGPLLIGLWAVGLLGAGAFLTDPVSGYPPGTPGLLQHPTVHGVLHDSFSLAGFAALTAACFVFTRRFARSGAHGWALYSAATGAFFAAAMVLASAAFGQVGGLVDFGGLIQRTALTAGWCWQSLLALHLLRTSSRPEARTS